MPDPSLLLPVEAAAIGADELHCVDFVPSRLQRGVEMKVDGGGGAAIVVESSSPLGTGAAAGLPDRSPDSRRELLLSWRRQG